jgi:dihydroflavonol-4-reductase
MVFVTGGTGLVGSYLIKTLLDTGIPVRALYRRPYEGFLLSPGDCARVEWVEGDILDIQSLEEGMRGVRQVYHCAAMVSFNPRHAGMLFKVNIEGTANVVNAALLTGVQKLAHVSSVAALGRHPAKDLTDESMNWDEETNKSLYGKSKYGGEMEVWRGMAEGLETVIVNPSTILGAGDWEKGSAKIFKSVYDEFPWYTEGVNGFVDVRDVARAMVALMESPIHSRRFILSADNWSYHRLFNEIAAGFGKRNPYKKVSPLVAEIVWRMEKIKGLITGKDPLLTKETAHTAQAVSRFDNGKVQEALPEFRFTPLEEAIGYHCGIMKANYAL